METKNIAPPQNQGPTIIKLAEGKQPPQSVDIEKLVLGAMLLDKRAVDEVIDLLQEDVFYNKKHQSIFRAIQTLFANSENVDLMTVSDKLDALKKLPTKVSDSYLVDLTQKLGSAANIKNHTKIILQQYIKRRLIDNCNEIIADAYKKESDSFDLLDIAEGKLFEISKNVLKKDTQTTENLVEEAFEKIKELSEKQGISGLQSGFQDIDLVTSGWQDSDLVIVAARPGMGKTAFVLSMTSNIAIKNNQPVAFFSLEMSALQLITRMLASETQLDSMKLRTGNLKEYEWQNLHEKGDKIAKAPIFINDTPAMSIFDLRVQARRLKSQHDIKILIVDYLQLMTCGAKTGYGNREQEIATISRNLKALAKELDIPIIALSQLSRSVETRGGIKRPMLSDLRESGAIEQDADIVSFLYRPEYYGLTEWDDQENTPCKNQAEFIIAKHRNGALRNIRLQFLGAIATFKNIQDKDVTHIESSMNYEIPKTQTQEAFQNANEENDDMPF